MLMQNTEFQAPFDAALNNAVSFITSKLVPDFNVADDAPSTYQDLKAHLDAGKTFTAAREGSEHTIFGNPKINYAFRAWHDWCHWTGEFDFSLSGECATCSLQIEHLRSFYGVNDRTDYWARLLIAEVIGQRRYFEKYQCYITDQRAFARAYLVDRDAALECEW